MLLIVADICLVAIARHNNAFALMRPAVVLLTRSFVIALMVVRMSLHLLSRCAPERV